jgi:hypothetical protein
MQVDLDQQPIPAIVAVETTLQSKHFVDLRPQVKPLAVEFTRRRPPYCIRFRHPQYPNGSNILLDLFALDHPSGGL